MSPFYNYGDLAAGRVFVRLGEAGLGPGRLLWAEFVCRRKRQGNEWRAGSISQGGVHSASAGQVAAARLGVGTAWCVDSEKTRVPSDSTCCLLCGCGCSDQGSGSFLCSLSTTFFLILYGRKKRLLSTSAVQFYHYKNVCLKYTKEQERKAVVEAAWLHLVSGSRMEPFR